MRVLIVLMLLGWRVPAFACSLIGEELHQLDANEQRLDTEAPGNASIVRAEVHRSDEPKGCGAVSSCGDLLTLTLTIAFAGDDRTPAEKMGYQLEVVSANPRGAIPLPSGALRTFNGQIFLYLDPDLDGFEAELRVTPIDLAGNRGPTSSVVPVKAPGRAGCTVGKRARVDLALPLGIALACWISRRRRRCAS